MNLKIFDQGTTDPGRECGRNFTIQYPKERVCIYAPGELSKDDLALLLPWERLAAFACMVSENRLHTPLFQRSLTIAISWSLLNILQVVYPRL
jgi:hypothetical protein